MPHRTTYFFPRQFPDRGLDSKSPFEVHESQMKDNFNGESDWKGTSTTKTSKKATKSSSSSSFTGDRIHGKQLAAFVNWLADKKGERRSGHVKVRLDDDGNDHHEHELLIQPPEQPPESEKERRFERQTSSFQGVSSGSSYCGPAKEQRFEGQTTSSFRGLSSGSSYGGSSFSSSGVKDSRSTEEEEENHHNSTHPRAPNP